MDSMRFDLLKELNNIGSGGALTSLTQLVNNGTGHKLEVHVPNVRILGFDNVVEDLNFDETDKLIGVLVDISGELNVTLMYMLNLKAANIFISTLTGMPPCKDGMFDELSLSVIKEMGNIMFSAYVNTLTTMTKKSLKMSVPYFAMDMPEAIMSVPISLYSEIANQGIFVDSEFEINGEKFTACLVMVPERESYEIISSLMGVGN